MAIFRELDQGRGDRSAEDRRRHRQLVEESIKKNLGNIIAEESIIGQNKGKTFKIPIRGLKEYRFVYNDNHPMVATGTGEEKRGQKVPGPQTEEAMGDRVGNSEGEDIYETEITLEELINYLFEDLELPFMERKKFSQLIVEDKGKRWGIQRKGIPPHLSKKRTMAERIKRKQSLKRMMEEQGLEWQEERFPFSESDLRYQRIKEKPRPHSNAVVICIMDNSGSMYLTKKYLARSFFFLLYQFVLYRYVNVELVFISHTAAAQEVNEDDFFHRGESGGTIISSGYIKALEIIQERFNPEIWNVYAFHCSDGDNWIDDIEKATQKAQELCEVCNLFGYGEILPGSNSYSVMSAKYRSDIVADNFVQISIGEKEDIWPAFKQLLQVEKRGDGDG